MTLLFSRGLGDTPNQLIPPRGRNTYGNVNVTVDSALTHSAVWAALVLRANLISTMPVKVYRTIDGFQVEAASTPFLADPAGDGTGVEDWLYSSQFELDRTGNAFGIITARDALGCAATVQLVDTAHVTAVGSGPTITKFKIRGDEYSPADIWHERQYTVSGVPLGLSPIAYAAMSIGNYMSAQQFASQWFASGGIPSGVLRNANKTLDAGEARVVKDRYKAAVADRDLFVTGADWEYEMIKVAANESQFLETMQYGIVDIARFFGVPGDLIEAEVQHTSKITYANITQRNLQFLVMNLSAPIIRREKMLSRKALPRGRSVLLDTDAILRMDPQNLYSMLVGSLEGRLLAPSEARARINLRPFTPDQLAEFAAVNPPPAVLVGDTP